MDGFGMHVRPEILRQSAGQDRCTREWRIVAGRLAGAYGVFKADPSALERQRRSGVFEDMP